MIYLIFLISILLHEMGHIIIGLCFGYKLKNFHFLPFGAYIEFKERQKVKSQTLKNVIIFLSGPTVNFIISIIFLKWNISLSEEIVYTNIILGIFNLLPINPLDGGKIVNELLYIFLGNKKSKLYTYYISKIFLCIFTFLYACFLVKIKNLSIVIVILYLWHIEYEEYNKIQTMLIAYNTIDKIKI